MTALTGFVLVVALYCLVMGIRDRARLRRIEKRLGMHGDSRDAE